MPNFVRFLTPSLLLAASLLVCFQQAASAAQAVPQQAPVLAPATPAWSRSAAEELLDYIEGIGVEGLDPAAYEPERLRAVIAAGDEAALASVATSVFLRLTSDLGAGYVRGDGRVGWHMAGPALNGHDQQVLLRRIMQDGGVAEALNSLLPTHPQYVGLRRALAATPETDAAKRDLIRVNMERWRWMPRSLGERHVIVNVPAFTAALVEDGTVVSRHKVIVGKKNTPTPQLSALITGVTLNPWWNVPQSIIPELRGRYRGYQVKRGEGGRLIVRQPPGPANSLGRVKLEMQNPHAIYLHDTPAQALFDRDVRAFSHGCIRTQNVRDFAALLLAPTGLWDRAAIDAAIEAGDTVLAELASPVPAYVAYFTAAAASDGQIVAYDDLYGRDAPILRALGRIGRGGTG